MLKLLVSVFLTVIFFFYFLLLNISWTDVALIIMKIIMNGYKAVLKSIRLFPTDNNTSLLQR